MKISILSETKKEITLKVERDCCPLCKHNKIRNKGNSLTEVKKKCIKEFFLKDVFIKRNRYKCNNCNKYFSESISFKGISDEKFKPYLKLLLDRNIITLSVIEDEDLKNTLSSDDYWYILKQSEKILIVINYKTLEVKKFFISNELKKVRTTKFKQITTLK